ncbi:MAG: hypothetical protein WAX77_03365 [Methylococcaceae bacterium]
MNKYNPYLNKDGHPELLNSVVAYIDILGFKNLVKNARNRNESQEVFKHFHNVLSEQEHSLKDYISKLFREELNIKEVCNLSRDNYKFRFFTDCFLIAFPIKENSPYKGYNEIFSLLERLCLFQIEMIEKGFFIRGAISIDEFYIDEIVIYGKAGIDAYEAEQKDAKYPRIILTKSVQDKIIELRQSFRETDNVDIDGINGFLIRKDDDDQQVFVNYLGLNFADYPDTERLENHKNILSNELNKHRNDSCIFNKYMWVAHYHNYFCSQSYFYDCDDYSDYLTFDEYKIDLNQYQKSFSKIDITWIR